MDFDDNDFKLADCFMPSLEEGRYTVKGMQTVTSPETDTFTVEKTFYVAANTETLSPEDVFSIYPSPEQRGDFSGTLPFVVLNNPTYPWIKRWSDDIDGLPVPWLALIVVSEDETCSEMDAKHSELSELKENDVYFPYDKDVLTFCKDDDNIHILTIAKKTFCEIMPAKEDLPWLTHVKFVNLSAADDLTAQQDGWFSTIIANRFVPSIKNESIKSTVHLVSINQCESIPQDCKNVRFISIYHWSIYSERTEDKSFVSLVNGLSKNSASVKGDTLKPHYLRTGEKTYSIYRSPLLPTEKSRCDNINGEEKFTSDGRMIYDRETGIFDVSYSAAFNLGRLITLSHRAEVEQIVCWRKSQAMRKHLNKLNAEIGFDEEDIVKLCEKLSDGKLL